MTRKSLLMVLLIVLLAAFAGQVGAQGKTLTISFPQEPDSLNPMYTTMTFGIYSFQLYLAGAWDYDENYNPVPVLVEELPSAENGGISADGTTFTLKLKDGLLWSDGDPLDSADFVFTWEMWMSEANTPLSRSPYDRIASVEAPDPLTVVITFDAPYAPWLGLFREVLPQHVLAPVFEAEGNLDNASFNRAPSVASGPYILQEWNAGNFMRFVPNPNYARGVAKIDTVVLTFIPDDQAYVASLLAGDSELGTFVAASEVANLEAAGLDVRLIASGYNEGWFLNTSPERGHPALQDVNVRKAIGLGFDRFTVVKDLLDGVFPVTASWWENTPYANPDLEPIPYDPAEANRLLDEAGWVDSNGNGIRDKDGVELELRFAATTRQIRQDIQAVAQQQLAEIGIGIIIENYESNIFFNGYAEGGPVATGQYDIATWSSSPSNFPDPDSSRWMCTEIPSDDTPNGGNWNYYCDPRIDELLTLQTQTTDYDARVAVFHELDKVIYDAYIWLGVWYDADVWVIGRDVVGANPNGTTPFWDIINWDKAA
ncbi:MAG: ABC transporter substrate-binding protein [Chloroflexota bacterium]|nr:MAG: ABC transporter substrate-binding protein [Chloroflexota bacterium]